MFVYQKFIGEVCHIFHWVLRNNTMFPRDVQQKIFVKRQEVVICLIAHIFGMRIGHVQSVVREIVVITILLWVGFWFTERLIQFLIKIKFIYRVIPLHCQFLLWLWLELCLYTFHLTNDRRRDLVIVNWFRPK